LTAKNLQQIKSVANKDSTDLVIIFLLDSMTKLFTGDKNSTYATKGQPFFANIHDFTLAISKVDHGRLEPALVREMMHNMCGGDGEDGGNISDALSADKNVPKYLPFFSYFKTLSKLCQHAMIIGKETAQK